MERNEVQFETTDPDLNSTESRIIDAARSCFESIGANDTRMGDIATRAGVSRQTVYKHFSSKEDIIDRIGLLEIAKINTLLRGRIKRDLPFEDRLTEAISLSVEVSRKNPYLRRVIEVAQLMPRPRAGEMPLFLWQRSRWNKMLEEAQAKKELASDLDIDRVVEWILFAQLGLLTAWDRSLLMSSDVRPFVKRFIVAPLLSSRDDRTGSRDSAIEAVAAENRMLKSLVAYQALEMHRLRNAD